MCGATRQHHFADIGEFQSSQNIMKWASDAEQRQKCLGPFYSHYEHVLTSLYFLSSKLLVREDLTENNLFMSLKLSTKIITDLLIQGKQKLTFCE